MPPRAAQFYLHPYDRWYPLFQEYYAESLRRYLGGCGGRFTRLAMTRAPDLLAALRRVRYATRLESLRQRSPWIPAALDRGAGFLGGAPRLPGGAFHGCVGQYELTDKHGQRHRVCIDSCDYPQLASEPLAAWSDVYFKSNFGTAAAYPRNVRPCPNCSPLVLRHLAAFTAARTAPKEFDVCFLVHVAGGRDGTEGIEHNLRLAESVARLGRRACICAYLSCGDTTAQAVRLERAGIPASRRMMPAAHYWDRVARSRLTVIRLGMHDCIPWALTGAFALGACVVLDRSPLTLWPQPLQPGEHYLDLGICFPAGRHCGAPAEYDAVPERLAGWLREVELTTAIAARAAAYFDRELHPVRLGASLFAALERPAAPRRGA
jgi:hypothetical protein